MKPSIENYINLDKYLSKFKYRSNYSFERIDDRVVIGMKTLDVNNPEKETTLWKSRPISILMCTDVRYFLQQMREMLESMESHERDEWILFDGERVFDPHIKKDEKCII